VEGIEVAVKDGTGVANDVRHFVVKFTDFRQWTHDHCSSTPTSGSSGKKFGIGFDVVVVTGGGGKVKAVEGLFFLVRLAEQMAHFGGSYKSTHLFFMVNLRCSSWLIFWLGQASNQSFDLPPLFCLTLPSSGKST